MIKKLQGKRAVVVGGSRGIGKAIARAYLNEGAEVILAARNAGELSVTQSELAAFGTVGIFPLDISDAGAAEHFAQTLAAEGKPVDVLVNAAGIYGPIGSVGAVEPAAWLEALKINLYGTFLAIHYVLPHLKKSKRGVIINFVGGGEGAKENFSSYVAGKGGIARLTETVAGELKEFAIDVNAIAPGAVNTTFLDDLLAAGLEKAGKTMYEAAVEQKKGGGTPPEKVAKLALWLASDASKGLTGKILSAVWDDYEKFSEHLEEIIRTDVYTMRRVRPR